MFMGAVGGKKANNTICSKGATRRLRGLKPPSPLSQVKVEKKDKF